MAREGEQHVREMHYAVDFCLPEGHEASLEASVAQAEDQVRTGRELHLYAAPQGQGPHDGA